MPRFPLNGSPENLAPLPTAFYRRGVLAAARALLGQLLVRVVDGRLLVGRIVEVEAYGGSTDPAAHSYRGATPRCRAMFGPVGHAYVYFTYGNHHCMNVVCGPRREATAVLLRAVEPLHGLETMRRLRAAHVRSAAARQHLLRGENDGELARGPGKLTQAFSIARAQDGRPLAPHAGLWIARGRRVARVQWSPRVGLGDNPAAPWMWRCVDASSQLVTRLARSWPTAARPRPGWSEARP